jgi:hypothetical protein
MLSLRTSLQKKKSLPTPTELCLLQGRERAQLFLPADSADTPCKSNGTRHPRPVPSPALPRPGPGPAVALLTHVQYQLPRQRLATLLQGRQAYAIAPHRVKASTPHCIHPALHSPDARPPGRVNQLPAYLFIPAPTRPPHSTIPHSRLRCGFHCLSQELHNHSQWRVPPSSALRSSAS